MRENDNSLFINMPIVRKIALLIVVLVLLAPEGSIAQTK